MAMKTNLKTWLEVRSRKSEVRNSSPIFCLRRKASWGLFSALCLLSMACTIAAGDVIYVDADASGANNGTSWTDAYNELQDGLGVAVADDEIWMAEGTYKPGSSRTDTFQLINGVALYGGFAGGETTLDERDWKTNETILSGDLLGNDGPGEWENNGENSYHVVTGSGTDANAILDGFTITGGNAPYAGGGMYNDMGSPTITKCTFSGNSAYDGGGMWNPGGSPTLTNCIFSGNSAEFVGGGMYNCDYSNPTVTNCTFSGNWAYWGGGMCNYWCSSPTITKCTFSGNSAYDGGGMWNPGGSPTLTNCIFSGNSAEFVGGGMSNGYGSDPNLTNCTFSGNSASIGGGMCNVNSSSPTVTNCTFSGNSADYGGGGMWNDWRSSPTVTGCTFAGNSADDAGGGMFNFGVDGGCSPTVTNCTFSGNSAPDGSALACNSYQQSNPSNVQITNCILWNGDHEIWNNDGSTITITYSDIQGGWAGTGNIDEDPLFIDPNGLDGIPGTEDDNLRLSAGSPCIDAGDNTAVPSDTADLDGDGNITESTPRDLNGNLRFLDDPQTVDTGNAGLSRLPIVDMGAYEHPGKGIPGDLDGDGDVDLADFAIFASYWLAGK